MNLGKKKAARFRGGPDRHGGLLILIASVMPDPTFVRNDLITVGRGKVLLSFLTVTLNGGTLIVMPVRHFDFYCERTNPEFWAEPFNAWSNAGFVLVGIWALMRSLKNRKNHPHGNFLVVLSILMILVGVGSFLFHTFADSRTHLMDLIPIFLFTMAYMFHSFKNYLSKSAGMAWLGLVLVVGAMVGIELMVPKTVLNGSVLYLPPLLALLTVSTKLKQKNSDWAKTYFIATGVFAFALVMRTLDAEICEIFPVGTHFIWHLSNALFLGILMKIAFGFHNLKRVTS